MKPAKPGMVSAFFIFTLGMASVCQAQEKYPFFRDIREEGMGGAGIGVVDDQTALFINPAGLGKIRDSYFAPLNVQVGVNNTTQSGVATNTGDANLINPANAYALAQANPGQHIHFEGQTLPSFVSTNFGMGVYGRYTDDIQLNPATNQTQINYFNDYGAALGYCLRLLEGRLKIGVAGKLIDRTYINTSIPGNSTFSMSNLAQEGLGAGWDGSVMLSAPWVWLPSITAVVHDVGGTSFTLSQGFFYPNAPRPPDQQQSVDAGFALFPIFSNHVRGSITAEYHDVLNYDSVDPWRAFHAGIEINFNDVFFIRAGQNEHYWTAGLEFDFGHNQIQLASYGEEIGIQPYQVEDRRYVVEYGWRF